MTATWIKRPENIPNVLPETMIMVNDWIALRDSVPYKPQMTPLKTKEIVVEDEYAEFLACHTMPQLRELFIAADLLNIYPLKDLIGAHLATMFWQKKPVQVAEMMSIELSKISPHI